MGYKLFGQMSEVCTCHAVCPCFQGQDPDGGTCAFSWVFNFDEGTIDGHDVSGLRMGFIGFLPGNVFDGNVRLAVFVDDRATDDQQGALLRAFTGELGGPLADVAALVGEVVAVERATIEVDVANGTGQYRIGDVARAEIQGFTAPGGTPTTVRDHGLSPQLGALGYPGKPTAHAVTAPQHGFEFSGNSSMQTEFHYVAA